ncbi:HK97 family phage prohead protease [Methanoculleus sp.]|jgi:HK97 family phage prohead protease|uniref:HK97 family phage prohead protease n=1 Tax=Methanoculleus sp. TaxID=90427 RepID=UPI0025EF6838|nr:HK97 family phage prohead protease [Methanoculleus sp.]MCK9320013.1 HK97 family phage prohead protease [Methanoculleus sp.]
MEDKINKENKQTRTKYSAYLEKAENDVYTFVMTEEKVDRDGEVVVLDGLDINEFLKNPQLFYNHESRNYPIGLVKSIRREGNRLIGDIWLNQITEESKIVKQLIDAGNLKTGSIGFSVTDATWNDKDGVYYLTKSELYEFSICNIPSNTGSVRIKAGAVLNQNNKKSINNVIETLNTAMIDLQKILDEANSDTEDSKEEKTEIVNKEIQEEKEEILNSKQLYDILKG